jgi:hypothetical protein
VGDFILLLKEVSCCKLNCSHFYMVVTIL